jgi:hypothetical protein
MQSSGEIATLIDDAIALAMESETHSDYNFQDTPVRAEVGQERALAPHTLTSAQDARVYQGPAGGRSKSAIWPVVGGDGERQLPASNGRSAFVHKWLTIVALRLNEVREIAHARSKLYGRL